MDFNININSTKPSKVPKISSIANQVIVEEKNIESLDEYSLTKIIKYLNIKDRIKLERVNSRFQRASKGSWSSFRSLSVDPITFTMSPSDFDEKVDCVNNSVLEFVLSRCGKYLWEIDVFFLSNGAALEVVAKSCPHIKSILSGKASKSEIISLSESCKEIENLTIFKLNKNAADKLPSWDRVLKSLFERNKNIRDLHLVLDLVDCTCFEKFDSDKLQSLTLGLSSDSSVDPAAAHRNVKTLIDLVSKAQKLEKLSLAIPVCNSALLPIIAKGFHKITEISLLLFCDVINVDENLITLLKNNSRMRSFQLIDYCNNQSTCKFIEFFNDEVIEEIMIRHNVFDDDDEGNFFRNLTKYRHLKKLVFVLPNLPNSNAVDLLANCNAIQDLIVNVNGRPITRSFLIAASNMKNLQILRIQGNVDLVLSETYFDNVDPNNFKNLRYLQIQEFKNLTESVLKTISDIPRLSKLTIANVVEFAGNGLTTLNNITSLDCYKCPALEGKHIKALLESNEKLNDLSLSDCKNIRNIDIESACQVINARTIEGTMEIDVTGTSVDISKLKIYSPNLHIRHSKKKVE